ncbi:Uncharacterised protein [BD1-7 clade bacterium]|uniref:Nucleoprotein/polynucleotide-associated enzyme n=1 Tax=BD1-7 clade bacterium TaxID=2029982 RepID=A0A5S9QAH8_9GAMM|nr:Uncharacterised protein [BD1-7 clade bacterium]
MTMASLQDQLLKAGLVDEKKAKQAKKTKRKEKRVAHKSKEAPMDENKIAAQKALDEKAERDRELNRQRQEQAETKAIAAQVKQLMTMNKIDSGKGDVGYNFVDGKSIKKLFVTPKLQNQLSIGQLAIVALPSENERHYVLVPRAVAEKIAQRMAGAIVMLNDKPSDQEDEEDPYADFQIPDDLMW